MIRGGRSYVSSPPAFSSEAKILLVCSGNSVSVFSVNTCLQITSLEGHTAPVTTVLVVPAATAASKLFCYCWTASLDGTIRYWDFSVPELIKTIDIKFPIFSMVIPSLLRRQVEMIEKPPKLFAYLSIEDTKELEKQSKALHGQIRKCNLSDSRLLGGVTLAETKKPESITISSSGNSQSSARFTYGKSLVLILIVQWLRRSHCIIQKARQFLHSTHLRELLLQEM